MARLFRPQPQGRELQRHPLWLVRPYAIGAALIGAGAGLATASPELLERQEFRVALVVVELLSMWRCFLLPLMEWRTFRFCIEDDGIEVHEFGITGMLLHRYPSANTQLSCEQPFWLMPLNAGTIVLRAGAATLRYTLLTPIAI